MSVVKFQRRENHGTVQALIIIPVDVYKHIPDVKSFDVSYNEKLDVLECVPIR